MTVTAPQTLTPDAALQQAVAHYQAGRLPEAEQLYRAILQAQPNQAFRRAALCQAFRGGFA